MRENLKPLKGKWLRWRATVVRRSLKKLHGREKRPEKVVLLRNLHSTNYGGVDLGHQWLDAGEWIQGIPDGSTIRLDAMVVEYRRGGRDRLYGDPNGIEVDFKLALPQNVKVIEGAPQ